MNRRGGDILRRSVVRLVRGVFYGFVEVGSALTGSAGITGSVEDEFLRVAQDDKGYGGGYLDTFACQMHRSGWQMGRGWLF